MSFTLKPLGDNAVRIEVSKHISLLTQNSVRGITALLDKSPPPWLIEYISAYTTVTIFYKLEAFISQSTSPFETVCDEIKKLLQNVDDSAKLKENIVKIPVLYGGKYGPDLQFVANHNGLTEEEVIEIHTTGDYSVHMIGFAPGFPFIGGMSDSISAPRQDTPRLTIPARTIGIAGTQTGIYPIETPGGWQLIGRTPIELFLPNEDIPSLLKAGDKIQFYQITAEEYTDMRGDQL